MCFSTLDDMQVRGSVEELLSQADNDIKFAVDGFGSKKLLLGILVFGFLAFFLSLAIPYFFRVSSTTEPLKNTQGLPNKEL